MNPPDTMNSEAKEASDRGSGITIVRRLKLIDYTRNGRQDMLCNRGTPVEASCIKSEKPYSMQSKEISLQNPPMSSRASESRHSFSSVLSASSSSFCVSEAEFDEDERVQFFLKIPSSKTRRRRSNALISRTDLMLMCEQQSEGDLTRRRSSTKSDSQRSLLGRERRRRSLIDSVLSSPDLEAVRSKYNR